MMPPEHPRWTALVLFSVQASGGPDQRSPVYPPAAHLRGRPACGATNGPGNRHSCPPPNFFSVLTETGLPKRSVKGLKLSGRLRRFGSTT
mgnify:CR=1 FL=1